MSVSSVDRCALGLRPLYMRAAMALLEGRVSILSPASPVLVIHCTAAPSSVQCSCAPPLQTMFRCTKSSQSPYSPSQLPLRSMRSVAWHQQSSQKLKKYISIEHLKKKLKKKAFITLQVNKCSCQHSAAHATRAYLFLRATSSRVHIFGYLQLSSTPTFLLLILTAVPSCGALPSLLGSEVSGDHSMKTRDAGGTCRAGHTAAPHQRECTCCVVGGSAHFLFHATLLRGLVFRFAKLHLFLIFRTGMRGLAFDEPGYLT